MTTPTLYGSPAGAPLSPGHRLATDAVRQVTTCSRGLSPKVAAAVIAELPAHHTEPEGRVA